MPLTAKGQEILANFRKEYGEKEGESHFYAARNKGTITGVDATAAGVLLTAPSGRALFMKRQGADHPGTWGFAFGSVEGAETPQQTALRELAEETGRTGLTTGDLTKLDEGPGWTAFRANVGQEFDPVLNAEHSEYRWASPDDLPEPMHPDALVTVKKMAEASGLSALDRREWDTNGWFEVLDNPLSTVGVYPYSEASVVKGGDPRKMVNVYRPAKELSDPETVKSFRLMPWTDDHPDALLGDADQALVPAEQKGVHGVIGEQTYFRDGTLYGNIKVFSEQLARKIAAGKRELSCGYRCDFVPSEGVHDGTPYQYVQKNLRGNHVASVRAGRMGSGVRVLDAVEPLMLAFALDLKEVPVAEETEVEDATWNESDHPRSEEGQFATTPGGKTEYTSSPTNNPSNMKPHQQTRAKAWEHANFLKARGHEDVRVTKRSAAYTVPVSGRGQSFSTTFTVHHGQPKAGEVANDSFEHLTSELEKKGYSKAYATKVAGKVAAEKGLTGHDNQSTQSTEVTTVADKTEAEMKAEKEAADRKAARDAKRSGLDAMRAKDGMTSEEEEAADATEAACDAEEEREDEKDESKEARDRGRARDKRAGARDARKGARDKMAKDARDKGKGMDAAAVTALVDAQVQQKVSAAVTAAVAAVGPTLRREEAAKNTLYGRLSPIIGAFDHAEMTLPAMASYGLKKLGVTAEAADPVTALDFLLVGRSQAAPAGGAFAQDTASHSTSTDAFFASLN